MGVGSSYITLQSYGGTLFGFIIVIGGGLGLYLSSTNKGRFISVAVLLVGAGLMYTSSKIRESAQTNEGFEGVGTVLLGFAAISLIGNIFLKYMRPEPIEPRGGFQPQVVVEQTQEDEENESDGAVDNETEV